MSKQETHPMDAKWWQGIEITSEKEYRHVTDRLATELLMSYTPEQLAGIAAHHLIYVETLKAITASLEATNATNEKIIRGKDEIAHLRGQQLQAAEDELKTKLSIVETARFSTLVLNSWRKKSAKKRMPGLDQINEAKGAARLRAQAIAAQKWQDVDAQVIRIGAMADKVYRELVAEGFEAVLPGTANGLRNWISPVAPDDARKGGRDRKPPKRIE